MHKTAHRSSTVLMFHLPVKMLRMLRLCSVLKAHMSSTTKHLRWSNSSLKIAQVREGLIRKDAEMYLQLHKRNSNHTDFCPLRNACGLTSLAPIPGQFWLKPTSTLSSRLPGDRSVSAVGQEFSLVR